MRLSYRSITRVAGVALVVTPLLFLSPTPATSQSVDASRTHVNVVAPWEVSGADPSTYGYIFLRMGVMETLVDVAQSGELLPSLATRWHVSDDGLEWRFDIRQTSFHDGSELTAQVVADVLDRAAGRPGPLMNAPVDAIFAEAESGVVVITLTQPFAALAAVLAHSSTVINAPSSFDADGRAVRAIGTGPFMVTELAPPQSLEVARFDDYWGNPALIETASYLAAPRAETRALLAESGQADLVFTLSPPDYQRLSRLEGISAWSVAIPRVMVVKVNAAHPFLNTPAARRALSMAIDREGIAVGIIRLPQAAANQLFPPILGDWHDASLPPLAYDPTAAREILAEQGWSPGSDGILTRAGRRFSLTLRTFPDRPELPLVATALQAQWREIGVELEVSVSNFSEIPAGHQDGSLDVALFARNYGLIPDPVGSVLGDFTQGGGDWGAMNWNNPGVDRAVADIAAVADEATRAPLQREVVATLHSELPLIPVVWYQHTVAYAAGLENVVIDPLERDYGLDLVHWPR